MSRILLVEDDTMIASGILYALETEGYETNHATGIKDASCLTTFRLWRMAPRSISAQARGGLVTGMMEKGGEVGKRKGAARCPGTEGLSAFARAMPDGFLSVLVQKEGRTAGAETHPAFGSFRLLR